MKYRLSAWVGALELRSVDAYDNIEVARSDGQRLANNIDTEVQVISNDGSRSHAFIRPAAQED